MTATLAPPRDLLVTVYEIIAGLPDDPTDIARLLHDLGIKGRRGDGAACPLARFIRWRAGHDDYLYVDAVGVDVGGDRWLELPDAPADFINDFDEGCYPTLVEHLAIEARP